MYGFSSFGLLIYLTYSAGWLYLYSFLPPKMQKPQIFHIDEIPWVDLGGGHLDKAMVTEPKTGMIVNVSRYPKGYTMGWHKHHCAHGMYIIEGSMQTNLGIVRQGEFVWFPAEVEMDHGATALEDCTFLFITNAPFDIEHLE